MLNRLFKTEQPDYFQQHRKLVWCFLITACLYILLAIYVAQRGDQLAWNVALFNYLQAWQTLESSQYLKAITLIGDKRVLFVLLIVIFLWFAYQGHWRTAVHWLSNGFICSVLVAASKFLVSYPRPEPYTKITYLYAFPSGHTALSIAIYGFLTMLIVTQMRQRKAIVYILLGLFICLIIVTRLLLGAHWFTDISGGFLLGIATLSLSTLSYQRYTPPPVALLPLSLIALLSLVAAWLGFWLFTAQPYLI